MSSSPKRIPQFSISVLIAAVLAVPSANAAIVNVFLIGGQSNADGRAPSSGLSSGLSDRRDDVSIYYKARNKSPELTVLQPNLTQNDGQFGPEVTFGHAMADHYSLLGGSVALIKYADGGTNLHTQWKADGTSSSTNDGAHYKAFQTTVANGLLALAAARPDDTFVISGMIWMQGESDSQSTSHSSAYEANLTRFISDIRLTLDIDDLPFVIGQLSTNVTNTGYQYVSTTRAGQANVAAADPFTALLDTSPYALAGDNLHFNAAGQMALGYGFAEAMLSFQTIPEPSTLAITSLALSLLFTRRQRR